MTLPLRTLVFWLHLICGLLAAGVIVIMSVTGVLLTYEKQMIRWANGYHVAPSSPGDQRLPLHGLVQAATATRPDARPASVVIRSDASAPLEVSFGRDGSVFVDPYTGTVLGTGSASARSFFRSVTDWHRWLARKDTQRTTGRAITGASNLVFFFIVMSGFYLWWPRTWNWRQFSQVLFFRRNLGSKARDFNWHNVIGYWSLVPLAVIVWSGVVISYPWASDLTYHLVGEAPPPRAGATGGPSGSGGSGGPNGPGAGGPGASGPGGGASGPRGGGDAAQAGASGSQAGAAVRSAEGRQGRAVRPAAEERREDRTARGSAASDGDQAEGHPAPQSLDALVARAAVHDANWTIITVRLPLPTPEPASLTVDTGTGAQPQKRGTLQLDPVTGETVKWEPFEAASRGRQWRQWLRFAHTGEWYGLTGQTIAGVVTAGSLVLAWTGIALSWRRFRSWLKRRGSDRPTRAAAA